MISSAMRRSASFMRRPESWSKQAIEQVLLLHHVRFEGRQVVEVDVALVRRGGRLVELVAVEVGVPVDLGGGVLRLDLLGVVGDGRVGDGRGLQVAGLQRGLAGRLVREIAVHLVGRLEERVRLHLLADLLDELHARQLEQLDRLLQLGRHHQLLRHPQALFELHPHASHPCIKRCAKGTQTATPSAGLFSGTPLNRLKSLMKAKSRRPDTRSVPAPSRRWPAACPLRGSGQPR